MRVFSRSKNQGCILGVVLNEYSKVRILYFREEEGQVKKKEKGEGSEDKRLGLSLRRTVSIISQIKASE